MPIKLWFFFLKNHFIIVIRFLREKHIYLKIHSLLTLTSFINFDALFPTRLPIHIRLTADEFTIISQVTIFTHKIYEVQVAKIAGKNKHDTAKKFDPSSYF